MSGKLLDTNVVINFIKGMPTAVNNVTQFETECCVSAVTVGELMFGAKKSQLSEFNKNQYMKFCNFVGVIDIDSEIAQTYGDVKNNLLAKGKPIPENDMWIAAVAIARNLTLISYDKHFEEVDGLNFMFVQL